MDNGIILPAAQLASLESTDSSGSVATMVPIEMYRSVFQFVGNQGLTVLSRVSRSFQYEAEHILYDFIDLDLTLGNHRARIVSWCNAVTNIERRAHRVHTLRFPAHLPTSSQTDPSAVKSNDETVQKMVAEAFSAIINLRHLLILGHSTSDQSVSINVSALASCTFSLSSFAGQASGSSTQEQIDFLLKHPNIKYWVPTQPFLLSVESFPQNMLPSLREAVLVRPSLTRALKNRPLEALVVLFIDIPHSRTIGLEAIMPLAFLGNTLHTLEYTHGSLSSDWSTTDILVNLSQTTPNLRTLTLTSFARDDSLTHADNQKSLVDAVARFHHLETLVLNTHMGALQIPADEPPDPSNLLEQAPTWEGRSPARSRQVATEFMTACPSLLRLSFPDTESASTGSLTYVRSGTKARLDGFYKIDNSGWWMR